MKTERNILIAFILNLAFSAFEFFGGIFTGSVAIISDALHDLGDALSIGISYFLEKKSKKKPDEKYTYGYVRYSVLGSAITTLVLIVGSMAVIFNAIKRIENPVEINYNGMIIFAIIGVVLNSIAAFVTREGDSLNQKAVNLHMLEDVSGWVIVLVGAVVMRFTDISVIDPALSIAVAVLVFINALKNFGEILELFLEKTPRGISIEKIRKHLMELDGVTDVHHIHVWSIDGHSHFATMHIVTGEDFHHIKKMVREELKKCGISHSTLELEDKGECCDNRECESHSHHIGHCHHHHHHHEAK